jgi:dephospho-CoA kinase
MPVNAEAIQIEDYTGHPERWYVGIAAAGSSGKDTVASKFESAGYFHVSTSALVREEIAARGLKTSRELQTEVANELRLSQGSGSWVEQAINRIERNPQMVALSGLYSPGEAQYLLDNYPSRLVYVEGPAADYRYERMVARSDGARDSMDYEEFMAAEERESSGIELHETNLRRIRSMADFIIQNTSDIEGLQVRTTGIIELLGKIERW